MCASCLLRIAQLGVQTWPGTKHPLHPFALLSFLNFPVLGACGSRLDNPVVLFVHLLPDAAVEAVPRASSALAAAELGARAPNVDGTCPEPGSPKRKAIFCMRSSLKSAGGMSLLEASKWASLFLCSRHRGFGKTSLCWRNHSQYGKQSGRRQRKLAT